MNRSAAIAVLLSITVGCSPPSLYHRAETPLAELAGDEARCSLEALRAVPVDNRTRFIAGTREPRQFCDAKGRCSIVWVQVTPDRWETYDANRAARASYERNCMTVKGYDRVNLPACSPDVARQAAKATPAVQPPLTDHSCALRLEDGSWQVVTPDLTDVM